MKRTPTRQPLARFGQRAAQLLLQLRPLEAPELQLDGHQPTQSPMEEQQVEVEVLAVDDHALMDSG